MAPIVSIDKVLTQTLSLWKKAGVEPKQACQKLYWSVHKPSEPEPFLIHVTGQTTPVLVNNQSVWPADIGRLVLVNTDDNEPKQVNGVFRMAVGRWLETPRPLAAFDRTIWAVVRRIGGIHPPYQGLERIASHGRDFEIGCMGTSPGKSFYLFTPDPQQDDMDFVKSYPVGESFTDKFQCIIARFKADTVSISIDGRTQKWAANGGNRASYKPVRFGKGGDDAPVHVNAEYKAMGFTDRYLSDSEVTALSKSLLAL